MLAPVPSRRRDGKSSFKHLHNYLAHTIDSSTGEIIERGEVILSDNLMSLETAAAEMQAVASEAKRIQADPVFHYVITWQPGEQPSRDQWETAALKTLYALGYEEHQFMVAAHADTENFHCHLMVNRVHPETFKPHTPPFYKRELDKTLREIEAEQGWQHSHGLAYWDEEKGKAVAYTREDMNRIRQERGREMAVNPRANKMEVHNDAASLEAYCRTNAAKDIKAIMKRSGVNWQHVHAVLKTHGLGLLAGDKGGYTVHNLGDLEGAKVKASQVFRDIFAGKANREKLVKLLGEFKPAVAKVQQVPTTTEYQTAGSKRDPAMREAKRLQRAAERQQLKAAYQDYRKAITQERNALAAQFKDRSTALSKEAKALREAIRSESLNTVERKNRLSVLSVKMVLQRRELRAEFGGQAPAAQTYRDWVADRAELGNQAAISQLRAFDYADKKRMRERRRLDDELEAQPGIQNPTGADVDPEVWQQATGLAWRINRATGDVTYQMAGREVFTDHGRRLTLTSTASSEAQAVLLALEVARQKYGRQLDITGSDEFKRRAVEIAVQKRLDVTFTDPELNKLKAELAQPAIAQKSPATGQTPRPLGSTETARPFALTPPQEFASLEAHYRASGLKLVAREDKKGTPSRDGMTYRGPIVHTTEHHVIQRIGKNVLLVHQRTGLPQATVGKGTVQILYGVDGQVRIVPITMQRSRAVQR